MDFPSFTQFNRPVQFQMALDEVLCGELAQDKWNGFLRFYTMDQESVTIGHFTGTGDERILRDLAHSDLPVVRRMTGGGIVFHGTDLVFSLGVKVDSFDFLKTVSESYCWIHNVLQEAFKAQGIETTLGTALDPIKANSPEVPQGACFENPVVGDLLYQGQKIAGGAQKRFQNLFLHQGSIALHLLRERTLEVESFAQTILQVFESQFGFPLTGEEVSSGLLQEVEILAVEKYKALDGAAA